MWPKYFFVVRDYVAKFEKQNLNINQVFSVVETSRVYPMTENDEFLHLQTEMTSNVSWVGYLIR